MKNLIVIGTLFTALLGGASSAAEAQKTTKAPKNAAAEMTKEQRENMAAMHEKMAGCLRSDKSMSDCHSEMKGQCQAMMGSGGCPMMEHTGGMMGPGMKRHRAVMQNQNSNTKEE